ncbi:Folate-binding protein involved in regulating the level of ATP-DnaA and in the modification of some tRNAs. It is probably a key factor in regulatory networks that act via tRNA modification [Seminavis robusta]|uniref:Folate-binding protein involved in regulating the level of ATP-DnaA and in the modification of some tRNAs. It is probably a key factor in regulatory networks that act via tRNA modification n=1 Tax=Seminavis robusta TaxID=568900 RepID=A0A9N8HMI9_9STRA|nr:Folate-binding protein involved in regulating the level of ATP-DnaA and in the modification of some tRNAs. It is probably a key factor in regulatory networks that act via tRNA modification [Seminavis robusta]|eukprot:Sro749_g196800.1 Folate-binding protein involved in regulating the level of ATP-DnaA and in the modification of some tRNAs. It is probably a key factor in regulatory networks that act via tRNA modification (627) ;mRNA; r:21426-23306
MPSAYPEGTPAGMRGEAVRAALCSSQCVAWKLLSSKQAKDQQPLLESGILRLQGKGVLDFLNNKLSSSFTPLKENASANSLQFQKSCLLNSKGRLVDILAVAYSNTEAFIMPSPGHSAASLFQKLDPFIFPLDRVKLTDLTSENKCMFVLASTQLDHVQNVFQKQIIPKLQELLPATADSMSSFHLPNEKESLMIHFTASGAVETLPTLLILPYTGLPDCAMVGYTFFFLNHENNDNDNDIGNQIWEYLISDDNPKGPVEIKALEYQTLRIEAGQPAFGYEMTGAEKEPLITSPSPLELHVQQHQRDIIDLEKGCYLGQEGIASILKNPRGPPRSLYAVVFQDEENDQEDGNGSDNLSRPPRNGDNLFVLGSNEEIPAGTLTSVAESQGTGNLCTVALALIRRPDSVLKQMKSKDLQIPRAMVNKNNLDVPGSSGMVAPPPMDLLDGLEVIVGGTFTIGMLRSIPSRRLAERKNMFTDRDQAFLTGDNILEQGYAEMEFSDISASEFLQQMTSTSLANKKIPKDKPNGPVATTVEEAKDKTTATEVEVEAEEKRKAEKMQMLQKRAEEALARRRHKKKQATDEADRENAGMVDAKEEEEEARRKAEKMKLLQQRAEEAIARRRKKN